MAKAKQDLGEGICPTCGKAFPKRRRTQVYCDRWCRWAGYRRRLKGPCGSCERVRSAATGVVQAAERLSEACSALRKSLGTGDPA